MSELSNTPIRVTDGSQKYKVALFLVVAVVFIVVFAGNRSGELGGGGNPINVGSNPFALGLNTSSTVTSTASLKLAARSQSQYRECTNIGNADVYWSATTTKMASLAGGIIRASSTKVWSGDSLWTGEIYGLTQPSATTTLVCTEI